MYLMKSKALQIDVENAFSECFPFFLKQQNTHDGLDQQKKNKKTC
jgi:hypothetical protein